MIKVLLVSILPLIFICEKQYEMQPVAKEQNEGNYILGTCALFINIALTYSYNWRDSGKTDTTSFFFLNYLSSFLVTLSHHFNYNSFLQTSPLIFQQTYCINSIKLGIFWTSEC